jgi:hypothetical protein
VAEPCGAVALAAFFAGFFLVVTMLMQIQTVCESGFPPDNGPFKGA